jgi:WD40 repeat protein
LVFSPDGKWIVSGSDDATVAVHDPLTGDLVELISAHSDAVVSVAVSKDGGRLATASKDGTARVCSLVDWSELSMVEMGGPVAAMACSGEFDLIAIAAPSGVAAWNPTEKSLDMLAESKPSPVCVAVSADGSMIAAGFDDSTVQVWSGNRRELLSTVALDFGAVTAVLVCPDRRSLIFASGDCGVRVLRLDPLFE